MARRRIDSRWSLLNEFKKMISLVYICQGTWRRILILGVKIFNFCLIGVVRRQGFSNHSSVNTTTISLTETARTLAIEVSKLQLLLIKGVQTRRRETWAEKMARVEQRKSTSRIVTTWSATLRRSFRRFFSVIKKPSILSADWIAPQGSDRVPPPFVALSSPRYAYTYQKHRLFELYPRHESRSGPVSPPPRPFFSLRLSLSLFHIRSSFLPSSIFIRPVDRITRDRLIIREGRERYGL